jgi:hypothetical protein
MNKIKCSIKKLFTKTRILMNQELYISIYTLILLIVFAISMLFNILLYAKNHELQDTINDKNIMYQDLLKTLDDIAIKQNFNKHSTTMDDPWL